METPQQNNCPQHLESYYFTCLTLSCKLLSSKCTQTWGKLEALKCPQHPKRSRWAGIASRRRGLGARQSAVGQRGLAQPGSLHPCAPAWGGVKQRCPRILGLKGVRRGERDVRDSHSEVRAFSPPGGHEVPPPGDVPGRQAGPAAAPLGPFPRRSRWLPLGTARPPASPGCRVEAGSLKEAGEKCPAFVYTGVPGSAATNPPAGVVQGLRCFPLGRLSPGSGKRTGGRRAVDYRPISLILFPRC